MSTTTIRAYEGEVAESVPQFSGSHNQDGTCAVRDISSAPSRVHIRRALREDDPAMRRRPVGWTDTGRQERHRVLNVEGVSYHCGSMVRWDLLRARVALVTKAVMCIVAFIALTVIAAGLGFLAQQQPYAGPTITHRVQGGESVWSLAAGVHTNRPLEQVVIDIEQLNNISSRLLEGQKLLLPTQ